MGGAMPIAGHFYSRPCGRGDIETTIAVDKREDISTHAPAGGATRRNSRIEIGGQISTHAPAGGATNKCIYFLVLYQISTHAPAGGATWT